MSDESDPHWLVIRGRRWRRTDPVLPQDVVDRLRSHLGAARSAVRWAKEDPDARAAARHRVQLAKTGLGERGPRWWEEPESDRIRRARDALADLERDDRN